MQKNRRESSNISIRFSTFICQFDFWHQFFWSLSNRTHWLQLCILNKTSEGGLISESIIISPIFPNRDTFCKRYTYILYILYIYFQYLFDLAQKSAKKYQCAIPHEIVTNRQWYIYRYLKIPHKAVLPHSHES